MADHGMKEALRELTEKKTWQKYLADDIQRLIKETLTKDFGDYVDFVRQMILGWGKHPFDVEEILMRAARDFAAKRGENLLDLPVKYAHMAVELACREINTRFRVALTDRGLPRTELINVSDAWDWGKEQCRELRDLARTVEYRWKQMECPDSIFDSATCIYVDLMHDLEARWPDLEAVFARLSAPFFGEEIGRLMYFWGSYLNQMTKQMYEGSKKERKLQADANAQYLEQVIMVQFERKLREVPAEGVPSFVGELIGFGWQKLTGEEMPVELMTVV